MDIADIHREFQYAGLSRDDLNENPIEQFEKWFVDARDANLDNPNALSLATVNEDGSPSLRTVLLKAFDEKGFVFFTNYGSRKAHDLDRNPPIAAP